MGWGGQGHYKKVYASVAECRQEAGANAFGEVRTYLPERVSTYPLGRIGLTPTGWWKAMSVLCGLAPAKGALLSFLTKDTLPRRNITNNLQRR